MKSSKPSKSNNSNAEDYLTFLKTGDLSPKLLIDFDQSGAWILWGEAHALEIQKKIGKETWEELVDRLKNLKLSKKQIEYQDKNGNPILNTSYLERPTLEKDSSGKKQLRYNQNLKLPYSKIHGNLKATMASKISAPNLTEVGSIILLRGQTKQTKCGFPKLKKIIGDLRAWQDTKLEAPQLTEILGDIIIEDSQSQELSFPNIKQVRGSIFARRSKKIEFPKLEFVGEGINGFQANEVILPKLKSIKVLKLDFKKVPMPTIKKILRNLCDKSLRELKNSSKTPKAVSITNPTGNYLYELVVKETILRNLINLKASNTLSIH